MIEATAGSLLGGRVRYDQPRDGYRTGVEPVLLAAAVPARAGDRVLEGGCGAGAALLCRAHRVPGIVGIGIERDLALVSLARGNADDATLTFIVADLLEARPDGVFDHAMANPPWHLAAATASPDAGRDAAKRGAPGLIRDPGRGGWPPRCGMGAHSRW